MSTVTPMYRYNVVHGCVSLETWYVARRTPAGCWIVPRRVSEGEEMPTWLRKPRRFVLSDSRKRWAWETRELALESLRRRTLNRIAIMKAHLESCEQALKVIAASQEMAQVFDTMMLDETSGKLENALSMEWLDG